MPVDYVYTKGDAEDGWVYVGWTGELVAWDGDTLIRAVDTTGLADEEPYAVDWYRGFDHDDTREAYKGLSVFCEWLQSQIAADRERKRAESRATAATAAKVVEGDEAAREELLALLGVDFRSVTRVFEAPSGSQQVLVERWEDGSWTAAMRERKGDTWGPPMTLVSTEGR